MDALTIGIVEDDLLTAESIAETLRQIGYRPTPPARYFDSAIDMIKTHRPDLLLIDIVLAGKQDGIDFANHVNEEFDVPFIFLTANSDAATVARAKEVRPHAYLVKPFTENDLFTSIEIAINNYSSKNNGVAVNAQPAPHLKSVVFIKEGDVFHKVEFADILYVESDNVYLHIVTSKRNYMVRTKLVHFLNNHSLSNFVRIHRSYAVNLIHLESINTANVIVGGKNLPLQKPYKTELLRIVQSLK